MVSRIFLTNGQIYLSNPFASLLEIQVAASSREAQRLVAKNNSNDKGEERKPRLFLLELEKEDKWH